MPARPLPLVAKSASWPSDLKHSETFTESSAHSHTHSHARSHTECLSQSHAESSAENVADKDAAGNTERSAENPLNDRVQNHVESSAQDISCNITKSNIHNRSDDSSCNAAVIVTNATQSEFTWFGSFHQGNQRFSTVSRGRQCTCTSLMMLVHLKQHQLFTHDILDEVLIKSDSLYCSILSELQRSGQFKQFFLSFAELPSVISKGETKYNIQKLGIITRKVLKSADLHSSSLEGSLNQCFQISYSALLMVGALCSALYKVENSYYFYDSYSHDTTGMAGTDDGNATKSVWCHIYMLFMKVLTF